MGLAQQLDQGAGGGQADGPQQGRKGPPPQQHRRPLQGQGDGHKPGHQASGPGGAQAHHRRAFAMGGILGHLMEMGTEQHQGCGEGRTAAQHQGGAPGDGAAARGSGRLSGGQGQQGCGGGAGAESQPAEGFSQAAVAQSKGRSLIDVSQAATQQHQSKDRRGAAQSDQRHQQQAKQQGPVGPHRHPIPPAGEIDQGMGLAVGIDAGVGIKDIVGQVFPGQQQHRRQQKQQQLGLADRQPLAAAPAGRQQHRHDRHGIHRPLDGGLPEAPPLGPWIRHEGGGGNGWNRTI